MMHTQILSETPVFTTDLFNIVQTELLLPNGEKRTHYNMRRKPAVFVFPILADDVYLISQYRYLYNTTMLEVPAGYINSNELPLDAAKRELEEETGLKSSKITKLGTMEKAHSVIDATLHFFLAEDVIEGKPHLDPDEEIEIIKIPLKTAIKKIFSHEITDASTIAGLLMINEMKYQRKL